jgi:hypothetical protein
VTYKDPGAFGTDTLDDQSYLDPLIVTGGDFVDVFAPAYTTFNVSYNLKDTAGNPATPVFRTVVIQDSTKPILYLRGMSILPC